MNIWQSLRFGARALSLKALAEDSVEIIERKQQSRLSKLLATAKRDSRFLAEKYASIDVSNFQLADLPTSSKTEIMEHFDDWLTVDDVLQQEVEQFFEDSANVGKLFKDKYALSHTSGSEGQSLLLVKRPSDFELMFALQAARGNCDSLNLRQFISRFVEPVRLAAVTMQPGFYPSSTAFDYMPEGIKQFIDVKQLDFSDEDLGEQLQEFRPTHLTAYASILHELARNQEAGKLDLAEDLTQIVNISERLLPKARKRYEKIFGAPILDDYGMGECLFLTNGCTTSGGMHVNADWAILEVVDANNQPVPDGERGEKVLLTNLANTVQPFIRYEVGDVVTMATKPCECGSKLPLIDRIEGRTGDMLHVEVDGNIRALHPATIEQSISAHSEVREYQIVQEAKNQLRIRVEPVESESVDEKELGDSIGEHLSEAGFGEHLAIEIEVVDRLVPDPQKGKFKRIVKSDDVKTEAQPAAV